MKKTIMVMLAVMILLTGCGKNYNIKDKVIVGLDESPIGYVDEQGEVVGFEVDLAREAIKRAGAKPEFKIIHWNEKEMELSNGNIDMIWNGMDITPERKEIMLFSKPYMNNFLLIVVSEGNPLKIYSDADFGGKKIGVKAGTTAESYIIGTANIKEVISELKTYDSDEKVFTALKNGEIDILISDEILVRYLMAKNGYKFDILPKTIGEIHEYGIGFRKDDKELRDAIQEAFDSMVKDGTAKKISEKWFQADLIHSGR